MLTTTTVDVKALNNRIYKNLELIQCFKFWLGGGN
jgi:hypothetical protein